MKDLLNYILTALLAGSKFEISELEEEGRIVYNIKTKAENVGLIIGKGGRMIKALRNIIKVRATLEKKAVSINIVE